MADYVLLSQQCNGLNVSLNKIKNKKDHQNDDHILND